MHTRLLTTGLTVFALTLGCRGRMLTVLPDGTNDMTRAVRAAVADLTDGATLSFAPGTYHFYDGHCAQMRIYPSNNGAGEKNVLFPLVGRRGVTIDGAGAKFVLHGKITPFVATNMTGLTVRNLTLNTFYPQVAELTVTEKREDGFRVRFASNVCPYRVTPDGGMVFETEGGPIPTHDRRLSLHALEHIQIHYLFAGDTTASLEALPATFMRANAEKAGERDVFFRYRACAHEKCVKCPFALNDPLVINLAENRDRMSFFLEHCRDVAIEDVTLNRGAGMGVVAQVCENVTVRGLRIRPLPGDACSITADGIQMINCTGRALVEKCEIAFALDDPINIHGNYLAIRSVRGRTARIRAMHGSHRGVFPYRPGDTVEFTRPRTREVLGSARVVSLIRAADDEYEAQLTADAELSAYPPGTLIENVTLNPDITIRDNYFHDCSRVLVAGRGHILIEGNRYERFVTGVYSTDSSGYWYESGRISDLTVRNNVFSDCNKLGGRTCIAVDMTGWKPGDPAAPKINGSVVLQNNRFEGLRHPKTRVVMTGVKSFSETQTQIGEMPCAKPQ